MAEYIDRQKLLELINEDCKYKKPTNEYTRGCNDVCEWAIKTIENIPTADVVPKSEVDRLQAELDSKQFRCDSCDRIMLTGAEHRACVKQAKAEVAWDIFEEIDKSLCKNKFQGVSCFLNDLAELKKKYTE